ncbi:MAG: hypothetical protein S4CHLAM123_11360 [Chlamydiales bacterium]|nr:hypothetical protein [Chlamydiales bacterium]
MDGFHLFYISNLKSKAFFNDAHPTSKVGIFSYLEATRIDIAVSVEITCLRRSPADASKAS